MPASSAWSHDIVLAPTPESAGRARDFVCSHLMDHELPHLVEDLCLVVSELATNALRHARTGFAVSLTAVDHSVVVAVGDGSDRALEPVHARPADEGGRGLLLVAHLSRDWGVHEVVGGGKSVWAAFDRG